MGEKAVSTYTYEAYLAVEEESDVKYEYHDGFIVAMAGGSPEHGQIAMNFGAELNGLFKSNNKGCRTYSSDVKVRIEASRRTFYPDLSVDCDQLEKSKKDPNAITNPILILEVLSDTTSEFDRGEKFAHYRQVTSLREYVLISQKEAMVDTYYRTDDGTWEIRTTTGLNASVMLKSVDCKIKMADIYRLVPDISI